MYNHQQRRGSVIFPPSSPYLSLWFLIGCYLYSILIGSVTMTNTFFGQNAANVDGGAFYGGI